MKSKLKYLSHFRRKRGLTQVMLAEMVDIGFNSIARYERDEIKPSIETAKKIADALGTTVEELLNGPASQNWELRLVVSKEGVIDMTGATSTATLNIGDTAMGITLSAGYELWEDDAKFEELINQIRRKRQLGLRTRREGWE